MTSVIQTRTPRWLLVIAMTLVLIVVLSSFALSFSVLRDLAAQSGIPADVAWLWPVIVDGTITAATLVLYTGRGAGRRQWLPLVVLVLFGLASVTGNVAHILLVDPSKVIPWIIAVFVGVTPPVGLILTVELLGTLLRRDIAAEPVDAAIVSATEPDAIGPAMAHGDRDHGLTDHELQTAVTREPDPIGASGHEPTSEDLVQARPDDEPSTPEPREPMPVLDRVVQAGHDAPEPTARPAFVPVQADVSPELEPERDLAPEPEPAPPVQLGS